MPARRWRRRWPRRWRGVAVDSQVLGGVLLGEFLRGEFRPRPESWVYRENWLVWYRTKPWVLDKEIEKVIASATGKEPKAWAWESLRRLYNACREADEPLPAALRTWVDDVVNERVDRPKRRGRKPDSYRNSRYRIAYAFLTMFLDYTKERAIAAMATATKQPEDTVCSILRRSRS